MYTDGFSHALSTTLKFEVINMKKQQNYEGSFPMSWLN